MADETLFCVLTDVTNSDLCVEAPIQTIMFQYEICCSWLQEAKLIANLLTLERVFFKTCATLLQVLITHWYVCMYVCMYVYKLYLMMVKTWLQSNLPRAVLLVKVSIEEQYILIYTPITIKTILNNV